MKNRTRISMMVCLVLCALGEGPARGEKLPVNLSVWYPLSINRSDSAEVGINLSLIYGRVGRVSACDLAGVFSVVQGDAAWLQMTGGAGVVGENFDGLQLSGFAAVVGERLQGVQLSGFANVVGEETHGLQATGFANIGGESVHGIQLSGFANIAGRESTGLQATGFANIGGESMHGIQLSGFANIAGEQVGGFQATGFANIAGEDMRGFQIAGFANIAGEEMAGLQAAGFANVAGSRLEGIQLGVVNVAAECRGIQVGIANVAGEQHGLPLGLYLREEREEIIDFVVYASNLAAVNVGAYSEANRWYSMLSLGFVNLSQDIDDSLISAWHFGRRFPAGRWDLGLDLGALHVDNERLFHSDPEDREALQLRLIGTRRLSDDLAVFAGAGLSWLYDRETKEGDSEALFLAGLRLF